jgi:RNA polymerase sigma-70 factor (family 1)
LRLLTATTNHTEPELLLRTSQGDKEAFTSLFREHWNHIYGVALALMKSREGAKDIVQDVFVKIWNQKEKLSSTADFRSYLFIITRNHIFNELRRLRRSEQFIHALTVYFEERLDDVHQQYLSKESTELIASAVETLAPQQRLVYTLSRQQGWRHQDIANHLGISLATVKTHMARALQHIRAYLEKQGSDPLILVIAIIRALL